MVKHTQMSVFDHFMGLALKGLSHLATRENDFKVPKPMELKYEQE